MHRATPRNTSFRSYTSGGARSAMHEVNDGFKMQTGKANGMKNETRNNIESPQNYGFTSVIADAMKGSNGALKQSAEAVMSFIGGNRSFPMLQSMDDRRHRLWNLAKDAAKGATAMFGQKEWGQQFLNTEAGMYMTGNTEKTMRFALVENQNGKTQKASGGGGQSGSSGRARENPTFISPHSGVEFEIELVDRDDPRWEKAADPPEGLDDLEVVALADGGGGNGGGGSSGGSGGQSGGGKPTGQKTLHKEKSDIYHEMDKDKIFFKHGDGYQNVTNDISQTYHQDPKHDTRCDENHVHIGFNDDNKVWVDKDGCWSSKPIKIRNCVDQGGSSSGPPATSGPPAYSADSPLALDNNGNMSLATAAPLSTAPAMARVIPNAVPGIGPRTVSPLTLMFKAPLFLDVDGVLTSTGGGTGGVPEAPNDGFAYGRKSLNWVNVIAIGDAIDGGTF
jgi:Gp45 protein